MCVRKKEGASTNVCLLACTPMHMQTAEGALTFLRYQTPSIPLRWDLSRNSELRPQPGWKPTSHSDPPATCFVELGTRELVGCLVCSVCAGIWTLGLRLLEQVFLNPELSLWPHSLSEKQIYITQINIILVLIRLWFFKKLSSFKKYLSFCIYGHGVPKTSWI